MASLLILSLLASSSAAPVMVKQNLPITAAVKANLNEFARVKARRVCGSQYRAIDVLANTTNTDLDAYYKVTYAIMEKAVKDKANGSTLTGELESGVVGYMYVNNTRASADDMLLILFQAPYNGAQHILLYGCDLK